MSRMRESGRRRLRIDMLYIPSTKYYYTDGKDIFRKLKDGRMRMLKALKRDCYILTSDYHRITATRAKLVWCATHKVSPCNIDSKFSFTIKDGKVVCEMFADKVSRVRIEYAARVKANWNDYDFIERYAQLAKAHLLGDEQAAALLYKMLDGERKNLEYYASHCAGGVGIGKAKDYTHEAIMRVYEQTVTGRRAVPSPIASIKYQIRKTIERNRKHDIHRTRGEEGLRGHSQQ